MVEEEELLASRWEEGEASRRGGSEAKTLDKAAVTVQRHARGRDARKELVASVLARKAREAEAEAAEKAAGPAAEAAAAAVTQAAEVEAEAEAAAWASRQEEILRQDDGIK